MWAQKYKILFFILLTLPLLAYQNCGKNNSVEGSLDTVNTPTEDGTSVISAQDYHISITPASKLGTYSILEGSCQRLELTAFKNERGLPVFDQIKTLASIQVALENTFTNDGQPNYSAYATKVSYSSEMDCERGVNGSESFIYKSLNSETPVYRWIESDSKSALPAGKKYVTLRVVNLNHPDPYKSVWSTSLTVAQDGEPILSLIGPKFVTKDDCIPYNVSYSNFAGQSFPIGESGYYFSNYSSDSALTYEPFSDANCTQSILNKKNNKQTTIYIKFYSEPFSSRASPTIVHVTPEIKIKVGGMTVWTVN